MTNRQFIDAIIEMYQGAKKLNFDHQPYTIWRGVSRSVSGLAEDLFALFVARELNDDSLEFIIDKTMSIETLEGKNISFRPDLAIVKKGVITHILDMKMDMGYKRRFHETPEFKKEEKKMTILRNGEYKKITYKSHGNEVGLKTHNNIINQIVVISEKNEGKSSNRLDLIDTISPLDWINIYYLSGGIHPNSGKKTKDEITINDDQFDVLFKDMKSNLL
ncbi:hypothetical protein [Lewinella sp. LCG006]|uniref:hypothetical protein n=1 Tax=Lewinella sp. LCG006 TaxID=3231911 RepID=UPI0034615405